MSAVEPVGPHPTASNCLLGALMFAELPEVTAVLGWVTDDDLDAPESTVLAAVRTLAGRGVSPVPQLLADELRRTGRLARPVAAVLPVATTSGACSQSARHYAAAVVADSLRRRVESFGNALSAAAYTAAEVDLAPLVAQAAKTVTDCSRRLELLRGEN